MTDEVPVTIGKKPLPMKERPRGIEGNPFPQASPITVPEGAKGIHNLYCNDTCGFYTVSPYTVEEWASIGREDKITCPVCQEQLSGEIIKMPMRVTDRVPVANMDEDPMGLLGKGRHERWDFSGGAGYYNRIIINEGKRDKQAWQKMDNWAKGGSAADEVASERAAEKLETEDE